MTTTSAQNTHHPDSDHLHLRVTVSGYPVILDRHQMTGLEIKQAAIAQGAAIDVGFQLSVREGKHYQVVGDTDTVTIHEGQEFLAVAPDDNS